MPSGGRRTARWSSRLTGTSTAEIRQRAAALHETNPMLGHRGCRLGITYPEIYEIQARAIFEAAVTVAREEGAAPLPEIMVPLVATKAELQIIRQLIDKTAAAGGQVAALFGSAQPSDFAVSGESVSSFTALRASLESSRSRLRTPDSSVYSRISVFSAPSVTSSCPSDMPWFSSDFGRR